MSNENIKSIKLKETQHYILYILYCNSNFLDGGAPFMGDNELETKEVLSILKKIFI